MTKATQKIARVGTFFHSNFTVVYENVSFSPESFIVKSNSFENMISRSRSKIIL